MSEAKPVEPKLEALFKDGGVLYEVCMTQFSHPTITSGQHTNGPLRIWVRRNREEWFPSWARSMRQLFALYAGRGWEGIKEGNQCQTPPTKN